MTNAPTASVSKDIDTLARTIYGEARGEPLAGKEAVAAVIMNRVKRAKRSPLLNYWWGADVISVCQKPWQFSCWNATDPNREKILSVTAENRSFKSCLKVAERAISGDLSDPTEGATHYHTKAILPPWARRKTPSAEIGNHLFYNDID